MLLVVLVFVLVPLVLVGRQVYGERRSNRTAQPADGWPRFHLFKRTFARPGAAKADGRSLSFHLLRRAR